MKKKNTYFVISCLMVLFLTVTSCTQTTDRVTTTTGNDKVVITETTSGTTKTEPTTQPDSQILAPDVPKYGGVLTVLRASDPTSFDGCEQGNAGDSASVLAYQQPMGNDWTRGPAGSGVTDFNSGGGAIEDFMLPEIAESWEMPDPGVWVLQIRQGIHWQNVNSEAGRLVGGREMTADDVVYSFNRHKESPKSWLSLSQPLVASTATIEKTGTWEVTIRTPVQYWTSFLWVIYGAGSNRIYPREVVEKYGNVDDWRNTVGTGPFIFADYIPGSSLRFTKNPDYWETDPVGPGKGNQLPYVDEFREMIIPDVSTQMAALRTGKVDFMSGVIRENWQMLTNQRPEFEYVRTISNLPWVVGMRTTNPDLPYYDVRVRQALMLATDFKSIVDDYYQGEAELDVWPVNKTIAGLYTPISELSETVQELFSYNPEKAKQLLTEAGYPNGFKGKVLVTSEAERIDDFSIFKDMWSKVGIEIEMDVREPGAYNAVAFARTHDEMMFRYMFSTLSIQLFQSGWRGTSSFNSSFVNDPPGSAPNLETIYNEMQEYIFTDTNRAYDAYKGAKEYLLEQAFYIPRPTPYTYNIWWPWLQNFYGQSGSGNGFAKYWWIDSIMKKSMGY